MIPTGDNDYLSRSDPATQTYWRSLGDSVRAAAEAGARQDAFRRLGEKVKLLPVGKLTLAEFVAQYDTSPMDAAGCLRVARQTGAAYFPDLPVVQVEMEVSRRAAYACLKSWVHAHKAALVRLNEVENCIVTAGEEAIRQVGTGMADPKMLGTTEAGSTSQPAPETAVHRAWKLLQNPPAWSGDALRASGTYRPAQGDDLRLGVTWATVMARVELLTRLRELQVAGTTTIADLARGDPKFEAALLAVVLSARPLGQPPISADGTVTVTMELPLDALWRYLLYW